MLSEAIGLRIWYISENSPIKIENEIFRALINFCFLHENSIAHGCT